eukprot:Lankesteria_metandrocarpae@DN1662_c0_g1_i1.p2
MTLIGQKATELGNSFAKRRTKLCDATDSALGDLQSRAATDVKQVETRRKMFIAKLKKEVENVESFDMEMGKKLRQMQTSKEKASYKRFTEELISAKAEECLSALKKEKSTKCKRRLSAYAQLKALLKDVEDGC